MGAALHDDSTSGPRRFSSKTSGIDRTKPVTGFKSASARRSRSALLAAALIPTMVVLALRVWVVEPYIVSSDSMEPTIHAGAVVFLYKPTAGDPIPNGDVVAFTDPADGHTAIKRVVAGAGQSVAIRDAELYVDDLAVPEPFIDHSRIDATYFGPIDVPAGSVFLLGDNRGVSIDSRDFGAVPLTAIQGTLLGDQTEGQPPIPSPARNSLAATPRLGHHPGTDESPAQVMENPFIPPE